MDMGSIIRVFGICVAYTLGAMSVTRITGGKTEYTHMYVRAQPEHAIQLNSSAPCTISLFRRFHSTPVFRHDIVQMCNVHHAV